jgi:hypothetical protein
LRAASPILIAALAAAVVPAADASAPAALERARAPLAQLERSGVERSFGARFLRYRQHVGGLPVLGAEAVLTDLPGSRADLLVDRTRTVGRPPPARLSGAAATRIALRSIGRRALTARPRRSLAVLPLSSGARAVWRVLVPVAAPSGALELLVDARSGRVLRTRDLIVRASGRGRVFDPNPIVMLGGVGGLPASGDSENPPAFPYRAVGLPRLEDGSNCLRGPWVNATTAGSAVCATGRDFTAVTRSHDAFEAVMAYFHVDRTQAYIQSLGFTNVMNRQLLVRANAVAEDNSYYHPVTKDVELGRGGTEDGEDAETIVHEYGHAIQDNQVPGWGGSDDSYAMGEGFGDYFASSIADRVTPRAGFGACWSEWDAFGLGKPGNPPCLRRVDRGETLAQRRAACPAAPPHFGEEPHCLGEVWSAALWAIRSVVGSAVADRLVLQSHFSLVPGATFAQAAHALLAADSALYSNAHRGTLRDLLAARGFVDGERLDDRPQDAIPIGFPGAASGRLDIGGDRDDVYRLALGARRPVRILLATDGFDAGLRLLGPDATSAGSAPVASSVRPGGSEVVRYTAAGAGTYFVDVAAAAGAGSYSLRVESDDADGDGIADGRDRCPGLREPDQTDFDRDGHGDACDRSARASIRRVSARRGRLVVTGGYRPLRVGAGAWRLRVAPLTCRGRRCRSGRARERRGARRAARGIARLSLRLRPGRYRIQAVIRSRRHSVARSRSVTVRVPR